MPKGSRERGRARLGEILMRQGQMREDQIAFLASLQKAYEKVGKFHKIGDLIIAHRAASAIAVTEALVYQESAPTESITRVLDALKHFPFFKK